MSNSIDDLFPEEDDHRIFSRSNKKGYSDWYREREESKIWWIENLENVGELLFSFDRKKIYNFFKDYPQNMTNEEVEIFNKENPSWIDFFQ